MGNAVAELCASPELRRAMGQAAARKIREQYSMQACIARYVAIYDAVLSDRPLPESVRA
jgi:glycosyltransferase involved in cell wall biosynthesis